MTEWTWAGTNTGPLVLRDGTQVSPTGKRVELRGMELAQMREGKISVYHMYWDGLAILRQLGLLDGGCSAPARMRAASGLRRSLRAVSRVSAHRAPRAGALPVCWLIALLGLTPSTTQTRPYVNAAPILGRDCPGLAALV